MPRILVLTPCATDDTRALANRSLPLGAGTTLTYRAVPAPHGPAATFFDAALEDLAVFGAGANAQEDGFDAVCVHSLNEGGAAALRSVLDILVLCTGKAAALHALSVGARFSFIVDSPAASELLRSHLRQWGLTSQCASVRAALPTDPAAMRDAVERCANEDGAEAVCLGSSASTPIVDDLGLTAGIPVIDPLAVGCQLVESLLAVGLSHSRTASPRPLVPKVRTLQAMAGVAASPPEPN